MCSLTSKRSPLRSRRPFNRMNIYLIKTRGGEEIMMNIFSLCNYMPSPRNGQMYHYVIVYRSFLSSRAVVLPGGEWAHRGSIIPIIWSLSSSLCRDDYFPEKCIRLLCREGSCDWEFNVLFIILKNLENIQNAARPQPFNHLLLIYIYIYISTM